MSSAELKPKLSRKHWDKALEQELIRKWEEEGLFKFRYDPSKRTLVIDTPPPYVSGKLHIGQAAHYVQIDMVARAYRMLGYNVLFPFYADRNGLPVEVFVERTYGINPHEVAKTPEGRERFLKLCKEHLDKVEKEFVRVLRRLGDSFEYWPQGTDSDEYRRITQRTFIELWKRGLIYESERPVIWCPRCRTTLAEAELEYREEVAELYYIKFKVKETGEDIVIATTRPELIPAIRVVGYNPEDQRYKHLKGKTAIAPLFNIEVPIIEHPSVDKDFGTGIMMFCSYGDQTDVRVLRELGIEPVIVIDADGRMNSNAGFLAGLTVSEARRKIVEVLRERGLIVKVEKVVRRVPVCWRCKTPVEFIHMKEFFLKQLAYRDELLEMINKIKFYPPEHKRKLIDWINSLAMDWPISRTRYYATEVPVWRCRKCGAILVPEPGRYYRPWRDKPPWDRCPRCGAPAEYLEGEKRVFDTWFDSSISVLYAAGITKYPQVFKDWLEGKAFAMRPQGIDIIRTWLYYTLLRVYQLYRRPAFAMVRLTGMGLDEKGEAMHKSKGNIIDPDPVIEKYGADAVRFWSAAASKLGSDYRYQEQVVRTGLLFANKLWNIARFVSSFPQVENLACVTEVDLALLSKLADLVDRCRRAYEKLDVYEPVHSIYDFAWNVFASHYIELVKNRAYNRNNEFSREEQESAWYTLHTALRAILLLLAPIMPFVTDYIWRELYGSGRSIHTELFPQVEELWRKGRGELFDKVMELNSAVWSYKKSRNMGLGARLNAVLYIPPELEPFAKDLKSMHRVERVEVLRGEVPSNAIKLIEGVYLLPLESR